MTERQKIIARKLAIQSAKNKLKQISGIALLKLFGENENPSLNELCSAYFSTFEYNLEPYSKLPYKSPKEKIFSWIIDTMELREKGEYYLFCGLWSKIKILDLKSAVSSLWRIDEDTVGFLLAETDLSRILECGLDSRDEYHYVIDIFENVEGEESGMKPDIQIKKASEADLDQIEKLYGDICGYLETHKNYPGWKKGIYPARCDAEKGLMEDALYIARLGDQTVGSMILKHEPEEGYSNGRWLTEDDYSRIYVVYILAVHPAFLKCGIGTELLMFAEQTARKEHCVSIRLDVVKDNFPAEQLYQKCGYQLIGTVSLGYEAFGIPWYNLYEKLI